MAWLDPSAVIGGKLRTIGGYVRSGATQRFVYEACEFKDTFLSTHPDIALVLNIDNDHMEYFHTVENAMNLLNISPFAQYVVRGLILLAAVIFDRYKQKAKRTV